MFENDGYLLEKIFPENNQRVINQKRQDITVIIGNPPYSGESANKGEWIMKLMEDYKKEPGGVQKLQERNPKWINDDYVKFMRFGQHFIDKNGSGILAFINPHGFLDNPTFRGMRWNLLKTYDKIYTIDLHGNSKKKETAPDGSIDQNVFDIMQGVSINFLVKTGNKKEKELAKVFHYDLFGKRDLKYDFLSDNQINSIGFKELQPNEPNYFFVPKDDEGDGAGEPAQGLEAAHFTLSCLNGWVACQWRAISTRRAHQTFSWLCTYSRKRASDARRAGRPSRRQCMPIESIFGAPATPSA